MLKSNKYQKKMTLTFLGIHVMINLLVLLMYGTNHPLNPIIKSLPTLAKIAVTSLFAFGVYAIFAYFAVLFKRTIDDIEGGIDRASIVLMLILGSVFIVIFALMFLPKTYPLWVIYAGLNPIFANVFFDSMQTNWISFMWVVSAFIPSLAIIFGMSLRMKHLEGKIK